MGKTTSALSEPWMAHEMTAKPRSGERRPVVMMSVMSTRTRRSSSASLLRLRRIASTYASSQTCILATLTPSTASRITLIVLSAHSW